MLSRRAGLSATAGLSCFSFVIVLANNVIVARCNFYFYIVFI